MHNEPDMRNVIPLSNKVQKGDFVKDRDGVVREVRDVDDTHIFLEGRTYTKEQLEYPIHGL